MSNIFKFHRRSNKVVATAPYGELSTFAGTWSWSGKAIGDGGPNVGYKAGTIKNGSNIQYSLIVCPRSNGQATTADLNKQFKTVSNIQPFLSANGSYLYGSLWDGLSNTNSLKSNTNATYPAVDYCKSLSTGGYNDWYLPARDELELMYRSFKPSNTNNGAHTYNNQSSVPVSNITYSNNGTNNPTNPPQTSIAVFRSGGTEAFNIGGQYYYSSCEASATQSWSMDFDTGFSYRGFGATINLPVRPVRRSTL